MESSDYLSIHVNSSEGSRGEAESNGLNSKQKQKMDSNTSLSVPVNLREGSIGEAESNRLNSKNKQKMDSSDYFYTPVCSSEESRGEAELNRLNSKNKQMENAESSRGRPESPDTLKRALKVVDLGIIFENPSTDVNNLPMLRVSEHIKHLNRNAYRPRLISIGPVHHDQAELRPMEAFKGRYAHHLIGSFFIDTKELIKVTEHHEQELRMDYGITSQEIPIGKFVEIMCKDAAFLVEFLLEEAHPGPFNRKWNNIIGDLFLLENQIPLYYLSDLLDRMPGIEQSVLELYDNFLDAIRPFDIGSCENKPDGGEKHLLDMLRTRMAPATNGNPPEICKDLCPTILQLHRAGIKFRRSTGIHHELTFQQGILKIPRFTIDHNTGRYFANLVASELFARDFYASDYIAIMDYLIDGPEDVRILVDKGIVASYLEDDKAAANFINEIGKSIDMSRDFHYKPLVGGLKEHCKRISDSPWSRSSIAWMRELKTNYTGSPWKTLSVIAAVILLGLTATQTVCSLFQIIKGP